MIILFVSMISHVAFYEVSHFPGRTFSTNLLAAAFSPLIMVSCRGCVMGERRTSSHRLPAPHTGNTFPLVGELPLDDTDLLSQSLGSTRLADAVLSRVGLIKARLQVMQLLFQWQPPAVLWQEQVCEEQGQTNYCAFRMMIIFSLLICSNISRAASLI